jgi:hypothetical protein
VDRNSDAAANQAGTTTHGKALPLIARNAPKPQGFEFTVRSWSGAEDEIRTRDLLLGKETRYHCATSAGTLE